MKTSTGKCNYYDAANMYSSSEARLFVWMAMHIVKKVKAQCINKIKQDTSSLSGL